MAKTFVTKIEIILIDMFSGQMNKTARNVQSNVNVMQHEFGKLERAAKSLAGSFLGLQVISQAFHEAIPVIREFDRTLRQALATSIRVTPTGFTNMPGTAQFQQSIDLLRDAAQREARRYALDPRQTMGEALTLSRTSLTPQQVSASLGSLSLLSKIGGVTDTETLSRNIVGVMRDFKMPMGPEQVEKSFRTIANQYAYALSRNVKIEEMSEAMKFAGPILQQFGVGLKEATASLIAFSDANIRGSEAGVALRSMMVSLVQNPKKLAEKMAAAGIDYDKIVMRTPITGARMREAIIAQFPSIEANTKGSNAALRMADYNRMVAIKDPTKRFAAIKDFLKTWADPEETDQEGFADQVQAVMAMSTLNVSMNALYKQMAEHNVPASSLVRWFQGRQTPRVMAHMQRIIQQGIDAAKLGMLEPGAYDSLHPFGGIFGQRGNFLVSGAPTGFGFGLKGVDLSKYPQPSMAIAPGGGRLGFQNAGPGQVFWQAPQQADYLEHARRAIMDPNSPDFIFTQMENALKDMAINLGKMPEVISLLTAVKDAVLWMKAHIEGLFSNKPMKDWDFGDYLIRGAGAAIALALAGSAARVGMGALRMGAGVLAAPFNIARSIWNAPFAIAEAILGTGAGAGTATGAAGAAAKVAPKVASSAIGKAVGRVVRGEGSLPALLWETLGVMGDDAKDPAQPLRTTLRWLFGIEDPHETSIFGTSRRDRAFPGKAADDLISGWPARIIKEARTKDDLISGWPHWAGKASDDLISTWPVFGGAKGFGTEMERQQQQQQEQQQGVSDSLADIADATAHPVSYSGEWPKALHDAFLQSLNDWSSGQKGDGGLGGGGGGFGGMGGGGGLGSGGFGFGVGGTKGQITGDPLIDAIFRGEAGGGANWNAVYGKPAGITDLSKMSLSQVLALGARIKAQKHLRAGPMGAFQIVGATLRRHAAALGMDLDKTMFTPETQIKLFRHILATEGPGAWAGLHGRHFSRAQIEAALAHDWSKPLAINGEGPGGGGANLGDLGAFGSHGGVSAFGGEGLNPSFAAKLQKLQEMTGIHFRIQGGQGYRSFEKQAAIYASHHPRGLPGARPGSSYHNYGRAGDLERAGGGSLSPHEKAVLGAAAESIGLTWGGRFRDPAHFQLGPAGGAGWIGHKIAQSRLDVHIHDDGVRMKAKGNMPIRANYRGKRMAEVGSGTHLGTGAQWWNQ